MIGRVAASFFITNLKAVFLVTELMYANARSLNNKVGSLIEVFEEYELSAAILTETWFKDGGRLEEELMDLEEAENIQIIAKNRRNRGGGEIKTYISSLCLMMPACICMSVPVSLSVWNWIVTAVLKIFLIYNYHKRIVV